MGACGSSASKEELALSARTKAIEKRMQQDRRKENERIKLLLLGAGESGKSTIFKQMKILYGAHHGYSKEERERWTSVVAGNILTGMKTMLDNVKEGSMSDSEQSLADELMALPDGKDARVDEAAGKLVKALWASSAVQEAWHRRAEFQVQDALKYYCEQVDRICAPGYVPTPQDILRARVRTSGIVEEHYVIDGVQFVMFDVGGQRNERKKWIHCFDEVTAIIFVAAINEYNQVLYEDQSMNRMDEAVILFDEICNSTYFTNTAMILFLNKRDLFIDKLAEVPFRVDEGPDARFTDFEGPFVDFDGPSSKIGSKEFQVCYEATRDYIVRLFKNRNRNKKKEIYHHVTTATDTNNVKVVFNAVKNIILQANLAGSGFTN